MPFGHEFGISSIVKSTGFEGGLTLPGPLSVPPPSLVYAPHILATFSSDICIGIAIWQPSVMVVTKPETEPYTFHTPKERRCVCC